MGDNGFKVDYIWGRQSYQPFQRSPPPWEKLKKSMVESYLFAPLRRIEQELLWPCNPSSMKAEYTQIWCLSRARNRL